MDFLNRKLVKKLRDELATATAQVNTLKLRVQTGEEFTSQLALDKGNLELELQEVRNENYELTKDLQSVQEELSEKEAFFDSLKRMKQFTVMNEASETVLLHELVEDNLYFEVALFVAEGKGKNVKWKPAHVITATAGEVLLGPKPAVPKVKTRKSR